jgi:hypothetical protein
MVPDAFALQVHEQSLTMTVPRYIIAEGEKVLIVKLYRFAVKKLKLTCAERISRRPREFKDMRTAVP